MPIGKGEVRRTASRRTIRIAILAFGTLLHPALAAGEIGTAYYFMLTARRARDWFELRMTPEEMKAIVDTAHAFGRKVAAHAHGTSGISDALRAGVDTIEHASLVDDEGLRLDKFLAGEIPNCSRAQVQRLIDVLARRGDVTQLELALDMLRAAAQPHDFAGRVGHLHGGDGGRRNGHL